MDREQALRARADGKCELCGAGDGLAAYAVPPESDGTAAAAVLAWAKAGHMAPDADGVEHPWTNGQVERMNRTIK